MIVKEDRVSPWSGRTSVTALREEEKTTAPPQRKSLLRSLLRMLLEGFALYGASLHPTARFLPDESDIESPTLPVAPREPDHSAD